MKEQKARLLHKDPDDVDQEYYEMVKAKLQLLQYWFFCIIWRNKHQLWQLNVWSAWHSSGWLPLSFGVLKFIQRIPLFFHCFFLCDLLLSFKQILNWFRCAIRLIFIFGTEPIRLLFLATIEIFAVLFQDYIAIVKQCFQISHQQFCPSFELIQLLLIVSMLFMQTFVDIAVQLSYFLT